MKSESFCYWLQGFLEINGVTELTIDQVECIAKHLNLVFKHEIDPSMGGPDHQKELNEIHSAKPSSKKPKKPEEAKVPWMDFTHGGDPNARC